MPDLPTHTGPDRPPPPTAGGGSTPPIPPPPGPPATVAEDTAPDGGPRPPAMDDRERELDPRIVTVWRVFGALALLPALLAVSVVGALFIEPARWAAPTASLVVLVASIGWYPRARHRRWRWRLTELALELRHGVVVHQHAAIPYFRIQQIDIAHGPVDRMVGIASLQVTTAAASGSARLPGIPAEHAPLVRAELLARAASAVAADAGETRDAV